MDDQPLLGLIERYWNLAWQEGKEGRTHDTPDGDAGETLHQIRQALRAYAEEAVKQEREAILAAIDDIEEKPWYGYENPNTFQDAKWAAEAVVRARSEQGKDGS
jgi:hypothetical protein